MSGIDRLIELLKETPIPGRSDGATIWSRSMVYVATEFGRTKVPNGLASGHDYNGAVLISPLLKGNRVLGDVDPLTNNTVGFGPLTGPTSPGTRITERHIVSAVAQGLGIDFPERLDMRAVL